MRLVETIADIREAADGPRSLGKSIGLVPTMGALHEGHGKLIEKARRESDYVVVSVFVNPLQFGPSEDFARYPRDPESDLAFCRRHAVDLVFAPAPQEMYPREQKTFVEVRDVTRELCGRFRPDHFTGVATVVLKLLNIVRPDRAYFGEKDAQQLRVIERMVQDLDLPVEIVSIPTVRESDGLAVSSRNRYLDPAQRSAAAALYRALSSALACIEQGERGVDRVLAAAEDVLAREPMLRKEYLEVVDADLMTPVSSISAPVRVAAAVWAGKTRLIDNVYWKGE